MGAQPHPCIYISMAAFAMQGYSSVVMTETVWPAKPKACTVCAENACPSQKACQPQISASRTSA